MKKTSTFQDLVVWQHAHQFVLMVYKVTKGFPKEEQFGLTSQFRRAVVSIAANIAEGYKKRGKKDKLRFFNIAQGSLEECRYYIILSSDLEYQNNMELDHKIDDVSRLLSAYYETILNSVNV